MRPKKAMQKGAFIPEVSEEYEQKERDMDERIDQIEKLNNEYIQLTAMEILPIDMLSDLAKRMEVFGLKEYARRIKKLIGEDIKGVYVCPKCSYTLTPYQIKKYRHTASCPGCPEKLVNFTWEGKSVIDIPFKS